MNFLITGAIRWTEDDLNKLRQLNHNVVFMQHENGELPCEASWVDGIVGNGIFQSHNIEQFLNLKYIQLTSAGFDRVPMDHVRKRGIRIHNARGVYSIPMAEYALCGVLDFYKHSSSFYENKKEHKWTKDRNLQELYGKTVCILGCGSVGTECAKRFSAFGCVVLGVDLFPGVSEHFAKVLPMERLGEALERSDILVLTLPLTEETKHLIDAERLKMLKRGAIVVNISRGAVIDTAALKVALADHIAGAVLDVFEEEPLPENDDLWEMDNVIITPHNSFIGEGNYTRMIDVIFSNIKKLD